MRILTAVPRPGEGNLRIHPKEKKRGRRGGGASATPSVGLKEGKRLATDYYLSQTKEGLKISSYLIIQRGDIR